MDWTKRYAHLDVTSRTAHLTKAHFILEVSASLVYPVATIPIRKPDQATQPFNEKGDLMWRIQKSDLNDILKAAWDSLNGEGDDILGNLPLLPTITNPDVIPYKDISGESTT